MKILKFSNFIDLIIFCKKICFYYLYLNLYIFELLSNNKFITLAKGPYAFIRLDRTF